MKTPTDEIERLNWAASVTLIEEFSSRFRWQSLLLFGSLLLLLINYSKLIFTLAFDAVFVMMAFVPRWKFKLYIPAVWCFIFAIASLLAIGKTSDIRMTDVLHLCMFGMMGYSLFRLAAVQVTVETPEWEKERALVKSWWQVLMSNPKREDVIEFRVGNVWFGYNTLRLMKCDRYWVVLALGKSWGLPPPRGSGIPLLEQRSWS